jgi:hypothetical protein
LRAAPFDEAESDTLALLHLEALLAIAATAA